MERRCGWRPGLGLLVLTAGFASASEPAAPPARAVPLLEAKDVFELEWAANPEISPDGQSIVYQRHWMDVMTDRRRSSLWIVGSDGRDHRPVGAGDDAFLPRWSPDGRRLLYAAREGQAVQLYVRYQDTGQTARLTHVLRAPSSASWSPDGRSIAFTMLVPARAEPFAVLPEKPEGATWADPPKVIQRLVYRADGEGYLDFAPAVSPDGRFVAYLGFDERYQGYQVTHLYLMNRDGSGSRVLAGDFDRDAEGPVWSGDGKGLYFSTADRGNGKVAFVATSGPAAGKVQIVASDLGGGDLGRPYGGGSYSVSTGGRVAYSWSRPEVPADVAVAALGAPARVLTQLNGDLLPHRQLGTTEEIWFESSHDRRKIQGWIVKPPGFDATKHYPLILEIHGGPFADYGDRFGAEMQLYAAAGYVVLYANPRGSTSYGEEFGNLIHHDYPGHDYDDLMSGVDAVLARGYVDPEQLFVTGGSGGGVLTAWIVGKTDRFRAAVSAKPVINWASFVLTSDMTSFFTRYWFPAPPWEDPEEYLRRSPLQYVGNVKTPTMLLTGEQDFRTPISEAEQFFTALKLRKVDTALVRFPGASHELVTRPSQLIAKVSYVLAWFERHRPRPAAR